MKRPSMVMGSETEYSVYWSEQKFEPEGVSLEDVVAEQVGLAIAEGFEGQGVEELMAAELSFSTVVDAMVVAALNDSRIMGPQIAMTLGTTQNDGFLHNGARFYNDIGAPEYSTPECSRPDILVAHTEAGKRIEFMTAEIAGRQLGRQVDVYTKNSDGRDHTYGCHENYCISAPLWKDIMKAKISNLHRVLGTFFIVRQVLCGAGKVGIEGDSSPEVPFQITQRMDFVTRLRGDSTVSHRPLLQTRPEPHADPEKWQRLHYIMGDANICEVPTYLKFGLTALLLMMLQDPRGRGFTLPVFPGKDKYPFFAKLVSRDVEMQHRFPAQLVMLDSDSSIRNLSAPDMLQHYVDCIGAYAQEREFADDKERTVYLDVLQRANEYLELIRSGQSHRLFGILDWPTKKGLLDHYLRQHGWTWQHAAKDYGLLRRLRVIADHGFTFVHPTQSRYAKLKNAGLVTSIVPEAEIERAIMTPPPGRAEFRSLLADRFPESVQRTDWAHVKVREYEKPIPLKDPMFVMDDEIRRAISEALNMHDLMQRFHDLNKRRQRPVRQEGDGHARA